MQNVKLIIQTIDEYLRQTGKTSVNPVEANAILAQKNILADSPTRPGLPLRKLLRAGKLPHALQPGGKNTGWVIPHSHILRH